MERIITSHGEMQNKVRENKVQILQSEYILGCKYPQNKQTTTTTTHFKAQDERQHIRDCEEQETPLFSHP